VPETLTCPVCKTAVTSHSSMCFSCHLPIDSVRENQPRFRRAPRSRAAARWLVTRAGGALLYVGLVVVCATSAPDALVIVLPAALVGFVLHVGRGRVWLGLASAIVVAGSIGVLAHRFELSPFEDRPVAQGPRTNDQITYRSVAVANAGGQYAGTVELTNHTDVHADMIVTVRVYDGEQELGELTGDISLKPHSTAVVDLESSDGFRPFTDTVVDWIGVPVSTQSGES
jgi:hypothetical protein